MSAKHIADAEAEFLVVSIAPDFCQVGDSVVPFDIYQVLAPEKANYAHSVVSRGQATLKLGSVVKGVIGDAGAGVISGASLGGGDVVTLEGASTVLVEGKPVCRHLDLVGMNAS